MIATHIQIGPVTSTLSVSTTTVVSTPANKASRVRSLCPMGPAFRQPPPSIHIPVPHGLTGYLHRVFAQTNQFRSICEQARQPAGMHEHYGFVSTYRTRANSPHQ